MTDKNVIKIKKDIRIIVICYHCDGFYLLCIFCLQRYETLYVCYVTITFYHEYEYFLYIVHVNYRHKHSGIYPDPQGVITPPVFMRHPPNHLKFKGGYQGVFTGGCLCDCDGMGNKRGQILT